MERLGIYGGTFSPPHNGHLTAARAFLAGADLDRLVILPAGIPPHKQIAADDDPIHRLAMTRLAFADIPHTEVSDWEITQSGRSYTVLTLEHFTAADRELVLLVGTDMFLTLDRWYRPEDIFRLAEIVCVRREADALLQEKIHEKATEYREHFSARIRLLDIPAVVLSSTEVRGVAAGGGDLSSYMPTAAAEYLMENHLYTIPQRGNIRPQDLAALRAMLAEHLSSERYRHTLGVEQTALRMGALFAPDQLYQLRAAALLHDLTREESVQKQLKIAKESGIIISDRAEPSAALLHAITASALIAHDPVYAPFAEDTVIEAVRWHTTGRADMSVTEQIIFLADYIEPTRTHAACAELREQFWAGDPASMDDAQRRAYLRRFCGRSAEQTICHLRKRGLAIDENTLHVRNSFL